MSSEEDWRQILLERLRARDRHEKASFQGIIAQSK